MLALLACRLGGAPLLDRGRLNRSHLREGYGLRRLHHHFVNNMLYAVRIGCDLESLITRSVIGNFARKDRFAIFHGYIDAGGLDARIGKHLGLDIRCKSLIFLYAGASCSQSDESNSCQEHGRGLFHWHMSSDEV